MSKKSYLAQLLGGAHFNPELLKVIKIVKCDCDLCQRGITPGWQIVPRKEAKNDRKAG